MTPTPHFVDAEALAVAFLKARVSAPVSTKIPKPRPATFVRVRRTGGAAVNRVLERVQLTFEAWAPDEVAAANLAGAVRGHILNHYTGMVLVRGVEEISGPYSDPDPTTGIPRYTFTVALSVRAKRQQ